MEVLNAKMSVFPAKRQLKDISKPWRKFDELINSKMVNRWIYPIIRLSNYWNFDNNDCNVKRGKNVILNKNCDYLWKRINTDVLSNNSLEVIPSVTIKDSNAVEICPCVAELMI